MTKRRKKPKLVTKIIENENLKMCEENLAIECPINVFNLQFVIHYLLSVENENGIGKLGILPNIK